MLRVPSLPADLVSGQRVHLSIENIDLLAPELSCRFLSLLEQSNVAEALEQEAQ